MIVIFISSVKNKFSLSYRLLWVLAVAISSANTVSSIGLYYGVITTAGAIVHAFTSLNTTTSGVYPKLAVTTGYFAIARANGTNQLAYIFNNAGTQ